MREDDLKLQPEKKYIEIAYDDFSQGYLRAFCLDNGFGLTTNFDGSEQNAKEFDFHSTVWFTMGEHVLANGTKEIEVDDITPLHYSLFGENKNILVLEIESPKLKAINKAYGDKYNMESSFPDYKPHITLSYSFNGDIPDVPLPDLTDVAADQLNIKAQKD